MEGLASQAKSAHIRASTETPITPLTCAQGPAFQAHSLQIILSGPFIYEPNVILGQLNKRDPTIGAVCGEGLRIGADDGGVSFCWAKVCEGSSISSDMLLLLRHKFPLGATPRSVNDTGSSRGFQHQANLSPPPWSRG